MSACWEMAELSESRAVAQNWLWLRFRAPRVAGSAHPGQFVMLGPLEDDSLDPFLNRPYSIHRRPDQEHLDLLVARVGRASKALVHLRPGARVPLLGPLGKGFERLAAHRQALLVAGGVGVAPLVFLAEELVTAGLPVHLVLGAPRADALLDTAELARRGVGLTLCTDDGSAGLPGSALAGLTAWLAGREFESEELLLAACGPEGMQAALARFARARGLRAQLSLENRMACGTGACMGCSLLVGERALRVCVEGPVFDSREVFP